MLKKWYESKPFTFGSVFIFFFMMIPLLDQIFIYPKMKPVCENQITDEQAKACRSWIIKKETGHVSKSSKASGTMYRGAESDSKLQWQRSLDPTNRFEAERDLQ